MCTEGTNVREMLRRQKHVTEIAYIYISKRLRFVFVGERGKGKERKRKRERQRERSMDQRGDSPSIIDFAGIRSHQPTSKLVYNRLRVHVRVRLRVCVAA